MKLVKRNQKLHNPDSPLLIGEVKDSDVVKEVKEPASLMHNKNYSNLYLYRCIVFILTFEIELLGISIAVQSDSYFSRYPISEYANLVDLYL